MSWFVVHLWLWPLPTYTLDTIILLFLHDHNSFKHTDATTVTTSESTLTFANSSSIGTSCTYCFIYIITGSVVGIFTLLVVCTLLFALMICIIIRSNNNRGASNCDYDAPNSPVYECIPNAVGRCLNPTVASVMTENEAYKLNTCSGEISAYDIVKT